MVPFHPNCRRWWPAFAILLAGLVSGCQPKFSVPSGVHVTCSANANCPSGYSCSHTLGRCIVPGDDGIPLNVVGTSWSATTVGAGNTLQVSFQVTKALAINPVVLIQLPKDGTTRPLGLVSATGQSYVYAYRVIGDEGAGAAAVSAQLVATYGDSTDGQPQDSVVTQPLGSVQLDFTLPSVVQGSAEITPAVANAGTVVSIVFKPVTAAGLPAPTVSAVHVGSGAATLAETQPSDGSVAWQFTVAAAMTEGATAVTADLKDAAGNESPATPIGVVTIDDTAPTLMSQQINPTMTHPGATLSVDVTLSEPLSHAPTLEIRAGEPFAATEISPAEYRFVYVVQLADVGTQTLTLSDAEDLAGNVAAPITVGMLAVSDTVPALVSGSLMLTSGAAWMTVGGVVTVAFSTTGAVQTPAVNIALASGQSIAMAQMSSSPAGSGTAYVFSHTISGTDAQGSGTVTVNLTDLYGNTAGPFSVGQFNIDTTPPTAPGGLLIKPSSPVPIGALLLVSVDADKILAGATISTTPTLAFPPAVLGGTSAVWSHTVTAADTNGSYMISATITDRAGNSFTVPTTSVTLDTTIPGATPGFSVSPAYATVSSPITATFAVSEALQSDPVVLIGAPPATVQMTKDPTQSSGLQYVFTYSVGPTDPTGALPITAQMTNTSGNAGSTLLGQVNIDFSLITPLDVTAAPTPATAGDTITVTAQAHKPLGPTASIQILSPAGLTFGPANISGSSVSFSHFVTAADPLGSYDVSITVEDSAMQQFTVVLPGLGTIQ
jgi:hypothetical protein